MKTKKSKIVVILILATMVLTVNVQGAYANENVVITNSCIKHNFKPILIKEMFGISAGSSGHYDQTDTDYVCINDGCEATDFTSIRTPINPHILSRTDWHSGSRHYVERSCSECSYSSLESWACPGNPCINYTDRIILEN